MYRNGKLFRGTRALFVLFSIFYVTTTLLSVVEGALPSTREITEARKTVGHFLGTEAGEKWLAELAKSNSAPLTTADLMKAILGATKKDDRVWQAAAILVETLKSQTPVGTRLNSTTDQSDNWKDLIADIEMEDDIVCLYRKSANETSKRADDWKQFMRTVSPGYLVHLAIDTGRKYVICLKKIEVPETTVRQSVTATEKSSSTVAATKDSRKSLRSNATAQSSTVTESTSTSSTTIAKTLKDATSSEQRNSEVRCKDHSGSVQNRSHTKDHAEDVTLDDTDSLPNTIEHKTRREMDDFSADTEEAINADNEKEVGVEYVSSRRSDRLRSYAPERIPTNLDPRAARDNDCKRPIIFFVPHRNELRNHQLESPLGSPIYGNAGSNIRWTTQNSRFPLRAIGSPQKSVSTQSDPSNAMKPSDLRLPIFGYDNVYRSVGGYQPPISKNIHFRPKISRWELEPFSRRTTRLIEPRKPVSVPTHTLQSTDRNNAQRRLGNYLANPSYSSANSFWRRFKEFPTGRMKTSMGSSTGIDSSFLIRRPSAFDQRTTQRENVANMRPGNLDSLKKMIYDRLQRFSQSRIGYGDRYVRDPASYKELVIRSYMTEPPPSLIKRLQPDISYKPRPESYTILNWKPPLPKHNFVGIDPRTVTFARPRQTVPCNCLNHMTNYQTADRIDRPYHVDRTPPYQMHFGFSHHSSGNQYQYPCSNNILDRVNCLKCLDKPIKVEIFIHGKTQEPFDAGLQTEAGQRLEVVGFTEPAMTHEPTAFMGPSGGSYELHGSVKDATDVDSTDPADGQDDKTSSLESEPLERNSFETDKNYATQNKTEITTVASSSLSIESGNIEGRFFHKTTIPSKSSAATNATTPTTSTTV